MQKESSVSCVEDSVEEICLCPAEGIISVISKKWALLIIAVIGNKKRIRFNKLMKNLEGISPKTLSERLKELEEERLIARELFAEVPLRVEYSLTSDGKEFRESIKPLMEWVTRREKK